MKQDNGNVKRMHKKAIFVLLGISFALSVISDLAYGKIEFAEEYMVGIFISGLQSLAFSLVTIFIILYLLFRVIFKDFFDMMFYNPGYWDRKYEDESKKKTKNK